MPFVEGVLQGVQRIGAFGRRQPLYRLNFGAFELQGKLQASQRRSPIHDHQAGAATPLLASHVGTGQAELVAQEIDQQHPRLGAFPALPAVDPHAHGKKLIACASIVAKVTRDRVMREGLEGRVTIDVRDYRALPDDAQYDKISSVGMVEHVGEARLPDYFAAAYRALAPGGLFLNHGIVSVADARPRSALDPVWHWMWKRDQFIRRYVFPDGDLVPVATVIANAERVGLELRDVESLRDHYTATLRQWVRRLESRHADAQQIAGEFIYRVWRLYMSAAAYGFRSGRISVVQSLLAKPDARGGVRLPRNRADLYGGSCATSTSTDCSPLPAP